MFIKNLTLRKKLIAGFGTIMFLLALVAVIGFLAMSEAGNGFNEYREMARDANLSGRLQANMLMVRMNVKDFIITGSEKDIEQYRAYIDKMHGFLNEAQKEINKLWKTCTTEISFGDCSCSSSLSFLRAVVDGCSVRLYNKAALQQQYGSSTDRRQESRPDIPFRMLSIPQLFIIQSCD